jgi:periplasmic protein TonB
MAICCLLFSSDERSATRLGEVLAGLGVEVEVCAEGAIAVEMAATLPFQIVIIDWEMQPEAGLLLTATRERKPNERPLTLALVSEDASVPKALQAGANSILRKPVVANQAKDTLRTARDLLRARDASATAQAAAAGAGSGTSSSIAPPPITSARTPTARPTPVSSIAETDPLAKHPQGFVLQRADNPLRGGDFLPASGQAPATHFDTESEMQKSIEQSAAAEVDPLKDLEPMAAAVRTQPQTKAAPPAPDADPDNNDDGPRGLEWYLKRKGIVPGGQAAAAPAAAPVSAASATAAAAAAKPDLIGFDQTPVFTEHAIPQEPEPEAEAAPVFKRDSQSEKRDEARLFAYIDGEKPEPVPAARSYEGWGKWIGWALALAACAIVAAPQAPWHPQIQALWGRGRQQVHAWLNPQVATTPQAPASHESFGRAGDEYKLPAAEAIPDATTDPSQIRVTPMVDPTAKKPNNDGANPDQTGQTPATQPAGTTPSGTTPAGTANDPFQPAAQPSGQTAVVTPTVAPANPVGNSGAGNPAPVTTQPASAQPPTQPATQAPAQTAPAASQPSSRPAPSAPVPQSLTTPLPAQPPPQAVNPATVPLSTSSSSSSGIPSSLKSQIGSMTPEASGNKPAEAAMAAIEPVAIPESAARAQLSGPGAVAYPASAKGQQGTVTLQVLVGRDGTVEDAKFMQGSLAFARAAIDGVKQWKFKPYIMNGRAVEVQAPMTITFQPQ